MFIIHIRKIWIKVKKARVIIKESFMNIIHNY